jgi:hypothetical protein
VTARSMSAGAKYGGAIAIAALAVALRWMLIPWLGADTPLLVICVITAPPKGGGLGTPADIPCIGSYRGA